MLITPEMLIEKGACAEGVRDFRALLGKRKGLRPTARNVALAEKAGLNVAWATSKGLIPSDIALMHPDLAYYYTRDVDKAPSDATRTAACADPHYAYYYALDVDGAPHPDTRTAACADPYYAYIYARDVDRAPSDATRTAACADPRYAALYRERFGA